MVVAVHHESSSSKDQAAKTAELYPYISNDDFRREFKVISDASRELGDLLGKEKRAHERTWSSRQQIYDELGRTTAALDERFRTIIERSGKRARVVQLRSG